ncbi:MAG: iron ABC transporter permease [Spirochaetaceae bacterium]|jgi:iron complex transport system permease protein|nr:iron ABC transporter permease [Spirochaetaceae bacterium]
MIRHFRASLMILLSLSLILAFFWGLLSGSVGLSPRELYRAFLFLFNPQGEDTAALILFEIRLPRLILAVAVGASLSVSGAAFQGIFRNSLADPYVIGASSGAALGAALAITMGFSLPGSLSPVSLCAFAGALGAVCLAFGIARSVGNPPPAAALLLAGSALGAFFSALLSLILVLKDRDLYRVYYWLLGSLNGASWAELPAILPVMLLGCVLVFLGCRPLDLLLQGEEVAESLGIDVPRVRGFIALGASLAAAAAVSAAGIIGFVGLIAPHAARMITGPVHKRLLPASALLGALLVVLADIAARSLGTMEFPIGIITSLGGAPFFIYLLARHGRRLGQF